MDVVFIWLNISCVPDHRASIVSPLRFTNENIPGGLGHAHHAQGRSVGLDGDARQTYSVYIHMHHSIGEGKGQHEC